MEDFPDAERWLAFAESHHRQKQQLAERRKRLQRMLKFTEGRLAEVKAPVEIGFFKDQQRLLQLMIEQAETYQLDTDVYRSLSHVQGPEYQLRELEMTLLTLRLEAVDLAALDRLLDRDMAKARAGEPPAGKVPEAWRRLRDKLATDAELVAALEDFRLQFQEFRAALDEVTAGFKMVSTGSAKARFEASRELSIPVVNGLAYRLNGILRRVPDGENLLAAVRPPALIMRIEQAPEEPQTAQKRNLTDRLRGIFKATPGDT